MNRGVRNWGRIRGDRDRNMGHEICKRKISRKTCGKRNMIMATIDKIMV